MKSRPADPSMDEIRRAAASEGPEPLYSHQWYRAALRVLLAMLEKRNG